MASLLSGGSLLPGLSPSETGHCGLNRLLWPGLSLEDLAHEDVRAKRTLGHTIMRCQGTHQKGPTREVWSPLELPESPQITLYSCITTAVYQHLVFLLSLK